MTSASEANPSLGPILPGYDPAGHQDNVALRVVNITTDTGVTPNVVYGDLAISGSITASNPSVSSTGAAVPASATYIGGSDGTNLKGLLVDGSGFLKVNVAAGGTSSSFGSAFPATGTAIGASDGTNMQALKVDGSGNLKVAQQGTTTVQQTDGSTTGTISAAQPTLNTPVSNATVQLALGQGQSTWKAQLLAGGGGFTSGTTIVADKTLDGGTTWYTTSFKVANASPATSVTSVVGPGPLELTGNAAGATHVRIRCNVLNATETIAVTLRTSTGVGDVGLLSSIPAGANTIGNVNIQAQGTALNVDGSGNLKVAQQGNVTEANSATISTNTSNTATVLGATGDAAVTGDNTGSVSAKLRGLTKILADIWDSTNHLFASNIKQIGGQSPTLDNTTILAVSLRGKNVAAGDTAVLLDSAGRLVTQKLIFSLIDQGQGFTATTGIVAAPAASTYPVSFFSPATSTKKKIIYSIEAFCSAGTTYDMRSITADPTSGWTGTSSLTPANSKLTGGVAADSTTIITTTNTAAQTLGGTIIQAGAGPTLGIYQFLANDEVKEIAAGVAGGIETTVKTTGTNNYGFTIKWVEI